MKFPAQVCSNSGEIHEEQNSGMMDYSILKHDGTSASTQAKRILFVDDERQLCVSTQIWLRRAGYRVDVFSDPKEALRNFLEQNNPYDIIITDYDMPFISGVELAKAIREKNLTIPILMISGLGLLLDPTESQHRLLTGIIQKPFVFKALNEAISKALALRDTNNGMESQD